MFALFFFWGIIIDLVVSYAKTEVKLNVGKMRIVGGFNGCAATVLGDTSAYFRWKICELHYHHQQIHDGHIFELLPCRLGWWIGRV